VTFATYRGQVRVEILDHRGSPARFLTPYVAGLYQRPLFALGNLSGTASFSQFANAPPKRIYVNRGLGTIGAPVRLGVPPEITLLTLRRV
jgi:predicted MPP superfamily phosphohydrolase